MNETNQPLFKIKQIENSIKNLSTQIKILGRSQMRSINSIQKCFDQCVPLIQSKIQQTQKDLKIKRLFEEKIKKKQNRILDIKLKKYDELRKKTNVKALIFSIKHKEANEIRQQSLMHTQMMKQQKQRQKQQKIKKSVRIKTQQSSIKEKIKSFHKQKQQDLSRIKRKEQDEKNSQIQKANILLQTIQQQNFEMNRKYRETNASLKNLKMTMKKIKYLKTEQFNEIINDTLDSTFIEGDNFRKSRRHMTLQTEASEYQSPIYGRQCRYTVKEQFVTTKIIDKILRSKDC